MDWFVLCCSVIAGGLFGYIAGHLRGYKCGADDAYEGFRDRLR